MTKVIPITTRKSEHVCSNPEHEIRFAESTEDGQLYCTICKAPFKSQQVAYGPEKGK